MSPWVVAVAAGAGAVSRYLVGHAVQQRVRSLLPLGTLAVNITGSLALGFLVGLGLYQGLGDAPRTFLGTGFLGAYTTFSTFGHETVRLLEDGSTPHALANIAANTLVGLASAAAGLAIAAAM